jgi:hypothetical protein
MTQPNDPSAPPPPPPDAGAAPPVDYQSTQDAGGRGLFAPPPPFIGPIDGSAKTWGMLCHLCALSGLIGLPFGTILGPLIIWLIKRNEIPFANDQGKESLNFQISALIAGLIISPTICLFGIGIFLLVALGIADLVLVIIATIKANGGEAYRYPYAMRLIK